MTGNIEIKNTHINSAVTRARIDFAEGGTKNEALCARCRDIIVVKLRYFRAQQWTNNKEHAANGINFRDLSVSRRAQFLTAYNSSWCFQQHCISDPTTAFSCNRSFRFFLFFNTIMRPLYAVFLCKVFLQT